MKRLLKPIYADERVSDGESILTTLEVVHLLREIEELQGLEIEATETSDGVLQFEVGNHCYEVRE